MEINNLHASSSDMYIMYLRKSRKDDELGKEDTEAILKRHEIILYNFANRLGITKDQIIVKREVVSGDTIAARPVMQDVLQMIEDDNIKGVLVVEVERLARGDTKDQGIIAESFKFTDTKIMTPNKIYDPNNEEDEEYFEFGLFMSRREYKKIKARLGRGRVSAANEGKFVGSTPTYGYEREKLKGEKGWTLKINEEEAKIVRLIFDSYLNHQMGVTDIARYLDNLGVKPRRSNIWSACTIADILVNPHYIGMIKFNRRVEVKRIENGEIKVSRHIHANQEVIYVKGRHKAIIDEETFDKVQELRKNRYIPRTKTDCSLSNPLAGLVKCKKCGRVLTQGELRGKKRLNCPNRYCDNSGVFRDEIEEKVIEVLNLWLKDASLIIPKSNLQKEIKEKEHLLNSRKKILGQTKDRLDKIYYFFEIGTYDKSTFLTRTEKANEDIQKISIEIQNLQENINELKDLKLDEENFLPNLKHVLDNYSKTDDVVLKNMLLKSVIDKIYYLKEIQGDKWNTAPFELWILPKINNASLLNISSLDC